VIASIYNGLIILAQLCNRPGNELLDMWYKQVKDLLDNEYLLNPVLLLVDLIDDNKS